MTQSIWTHHTPKSSILLRVIIF